LTEQTKLLKQAKYFSGHSIEFKNLYYWFFLVFPNLDSPSLGAMGRQLVMCVLFIQAC